MKSPEKSHNVHIFFNYVCRFNEMQTELFSEHLNKTKSIHSSKL